jgi:hypothetical protein
MAAAAEPADSAASALDEPSAAQAAAELWRGRQVKDTQLAQKLGQLQMSFVAAFPRGCTGPACICWADLAPVRAARTRCAAASCGRGGRTSATPSGAAAGPRAVKSFRHHPLYIPFVILRTK